MPLTLQMFVLMHMIRDSFIYTNVIDTERKAVVEPHPGLPRQCPGNLALGPGNCVQIVGASCRDVVWAHGVGCKCK